MKITPLFDRVLIKPDEQTSTTKSGIVLPSTSQERPQTGTIIAIGNGLDLDGNQIGMQVRIGDKVVFNKFTGNEVKLKDETLLIIRQIDLVAIMEENDE